MKVIVNNAQELPQKLEQARAFAKAQLLAGRKMQIEVKKRMGIRARRSFLLP